MKTVGLQLNIWKTDHGIHYFMGNRWKTVETVADFILGAPESLQMVIEAMKLKDVYSFEEKL